MGSSDSDDVESDLVPRTAPLDSSKLKEIFDRENQEYAKSDFYKRVGNLIQQNKHYTCLSNVKTFVSVATGSWSCFDNEDDAGDEMWGLVFFKSLPLFLHDRHKKELPKISDQLEPGLSFIAQDPDFNEQDEAFLKSVGVGKVEMTDHKNNAWSNITENTCLYCASNFSYKQCPQGLFLNRSGMKKPKPYFKEKGPNPVGKGYNGIGADIGHEVTVSEPLSIGTTDAQGSQWSQPYSGILPAVIITEGDPANAVFPGNSTISGNYDRVLLPPPEHSMVPPYEFPMFYFRKNSAAPVSGN